MIFALGLGLRLYGLNWDQGQHLHPDERFLTMVANDISWPKNIGEYFQTKTSPLNPENNGYEFFVYGSLPVFLTKAAADIIGWGDYQRIVLVGRFLAALADFGVIILLYKLSRKIWPSLFYALMVLPIQLGHFFAVDPWLNLFLFLSFYAGYYWPFWIAGIFLGLALSSKITAVLFLPILFLVLLKRNKKINFKLILNTGILVVAAAVTFRIFSPYCFSNFFSLNPKFIANLKRLQSFSDPNTWFPPAVQWLKTKPLIFPAKNILLWGLGIPTAIIVLVAVLFNCVEIVKKLIKGELNITRLDNRKIALIWVLFLFILQGARTVKTMRYFIPIYPAMAFIAGEFWSDLNLSKRAKGLITASLFIWPLSFMNIYFQDHPRIKASKWIYNNIPPGSTLSCELWDDCLPLSLKDSPPVSYQTESLPVFDYDTPQKWEKINQQLADIDYLILSSGRAWEPITANPDRYPQMAEFYNRLFNGELEFKKTAEFTSYPGLLGIEIPDDQAEEAFRVYDHPKVMIFKKN